MGSFPWGPHGPQSGPNQVTPNPTPAYVPPPPMESPGSFGVPAPASYGGGGGGVVGYQGTYTPGPKHYWLALPLTFFLGPLGLFYASKKGALLLLVLFFAGPYLLASYGPSLGIFPRHPQFALQRAMINQMWSLCVVLSMIWSVVAVRLHNKALKARN